MASEKTAISGRALWVPRVWMALRVSLALLARDIVAFGSFPIIIAIACAGASFLALFEGVFLSRLAVPVSRLSSEAADAR